MSPRDTATANGAATNAEGEPDVPTSDLLQATRALTEAVQALNATLTRFQRVAAAGAGIAGAAATQVNTWDDDAFSEATPSAMPPIGPVAAVDLPVNANPTLQTIITEARPAPDRYGPGTAEFRYWCAEEALARGVNFWAPLLPPGTTWTAATNPLQVTLLAGNDLNAFYRRDRGLLFYEWPLRDWVLYSAESPDVVLHELGHAILDAVNPRLFEASTLENAAFHEAFGDMSAILASLQFATMREKVIADTCGELNTNSRLSRLAERLGWALRQQNPAKAEPDCLRNAANRFQYQRPEGLPGDGNAMDLTGELHSFSRIFTGAFLDALANMARRNGGISHASLLAVSRDMGQILADAVRLAPDSSWPFAGVAAEMIKSDQARNGGRYSSDLTSAFQRRLILSNESVIALGGAPAPAFVAAPQAVAPALGIAGTDGQGAAAPMMLAYDAAVDNHDYARGYGATSELPTRTIPTSLGIDLQVPAPAQSQPAGMASSALGIAAAAMPAGDEVRYFVENLIQRGRVVYAPELGIPPAVAAAFANSGTTKTHTIEEGPHGPTLKRLQFNCGLCGGH